MEGTSATETARAGRPVALPSAKAFIIHHKLLSLSVVAVLAVFAALIALAFVGRGTWKVTDSTSCSAWSSTTNQQQVAYARLYVKRHGSLANGATDPTSIQNAVSNACLGAFAGDVPNTTTVLQAINGQY